MVLLTNLLEGTGLLQPSVCSLPARRWVRALTHKRVDIVSAVPVAGVRSADSCEYEAAGLNGPRQE